MGFHFEEINSVSIELKKENDILREQLAEVQAETKATAKTTTKKTTAGKRNSKKKTS